MTTPGDNAPDPAMAADHHYSEGLTIVNTEIAFYAGLKRVLGCSGLSVVNCKMDKVGQGVMNHWAKSNDFYIADNTMIGMHDRTRVHGWARVQDPAPMSACRDTAGCDLVRRGDGE